MTTSDERWKTTRAAREKAEQIIPLVTAQNETFQHPGQRERENTCRERDRHSLAGLFTFLELNGLPVWPVTEQDVLRYLHCVPRKAASREKVRQAVNRWHTNHGLAAPCGERSLHYVKAIRAQQTEDGTLLDKKTDGILLGDAEHVIRRLYQPSPRAAINQALMRVCADTGEPIRNVCFADPDTFVHNESTATVSLTLGDGNTLIVRQAALPDTYAALLTLAAADGGAPNPAFGTFARRPDFGKLRLREALTALGATGNPWNERNVMADLTDEQRNAIVDVAGGGAARRAARNVFLIVLGATGGYRYSDIEYLPVDAFQPNGDGYTATIPFSKTDPTGNGREIHLHHIHPDQPCNPHQPCDILCPVAAHDRHLWHTRLTLATRRPVTYLFQGDNERPLQAQSVRNELRTVWLRCGGNPDYKIGTRSLRVGAITSGYLEGTPFAELAELGNHRKLDSTRIYLRPGTINPFTLDPHT